MQYWEHVFFAGLFGVIALYPFVGAGISRIAYDDRLLSFFALSGIAALVTLIMYGEFYERRRRRWAACAALFAALLAVPILGGAIAIARPVFVVWFIDAVLSLSVFGYVITKHLFRRVERDFYQRSYHIILAGLGINFCALIFAALIAVFPVALIALIAGGVLFASSFLFQPLG